MRLRAGLVALLLAGGCGGGDEAPAPLPPATPPPPAAPAAAAAAPSWVGGETCAGCHPAQAGSWRGSHHDLAMQEAGEASVLGDFRGATLTHFGVTTSFSRRGEAFVVSTDGPEGDLRDYEVAYTFGAAPLQQLLIRFPGGRLQALGIAWDARPAAQGGQRWFHLYPDQAIPAGDLLHWTGPNQNWNSQCAACHSTGLEKGYRPDADRFDTTWAELDVSCEACHGPGSGHVAWARAGAEAAVADRGLVVDLRDDGAEWNFAPGASIARRSAPRRSRRELDTCAPCHARRTPLRRAPAPARAFLDAYRPALLDSGLYHPDGQIRDEVYVWGSFLQSPMYAAGVTCSDCHDPHALAIDEPDAVCGRCHRPEVFARPAHHQHAPDSPGASCVACHMPARTYMQIDARRDHSFRVPRPDLSRALGTPDACRDCHADRPDAWAQEAAARAWPAGRSGRPHFGTVLRAGRERRPGAAQALAALAAGEEPGIVRATALRLLGEQGQPAPAPLLRAAFGDADPLLRLAALEASETLDPARQLALARPLLGDPLRAVRVQAAGSLARVPAGLWPPGSRGAFAAAVAEYRAAQRARAERPEAQLNLAHLHAAFGELEEARGALETALRLAPWFVPAWVNLADVHRAAGREAEAERALRRAVALAPEQAAARHALGLSLVRQGRLEAALAELARAAEQAPQEPRYAYVYGVALHEAGQSARALEVLAAARRRHPDSAELRGALATIARDAGATAP